MLFYHCYIAFTMHCYWSSMFMKTARVPIVQITLVTGSGSSDKNNYRPAALVTAASTLLFFIDTYP